MRQECFLWWVTNEFYNKHYNSNMLHSNQTHNRNCSSKTSCWKIVNNIVKKVFTGLTNLIRDVVLRTACKMIPLILTMQQLLVSTWLWVYIHMLFTNRLNRNFYTHFMWFNGLVWCQSEFDAWEWGWEKKKSITEQVQWCGFSFHRSGCAWLCSGYGMKGMRYLCELISLV